VNGDEICIADSSVGSPVDKVIVGENVANDVLDGVNGDRIDGFIEHDETGKISPLPCTERAPKPGFDLAFRCYVDLIYISFSFCS
jgi:hypothetical protein